MKKSIEQTFPRHRQEQGSALIMALLVMLIMSIVVMGMAADSDLDLKISRNLQLKNQAFNNAETGIALVYEVLRQSVTAHHIGNENGTNITSVSFGDYNLNFSNDLKEIYAFGGEATIFRSGTNEPIATVKITSRDWNSIKWFELYSTGRKDISEQVVKVLISEDTDTTPEHLIPLSPLSLFNKNPTLTLKGNSLVSGKNYPVPSVFECKGDGCSPASPNLDEEKLPLYSHSEIAENDIVQQGEKAEILDFDYNSMNIGTSEVSDEKWMEIATNLEKMANNIFKSGDTIPDILGTRDNPELTVIKGGQNVNSFNGAGILILHGGARITGNAHFEGLVINIISPNEGAHLFSGGNNTIYGGMLVLGAEADIEIDGDEGGSVDFAGTPSVLHSVEGLNSALAAFAKNAPLHVSSWKTD